MNSQNIRRKFIEFFEKKGHKHLPSSSLIPEADPSVLFTTAGMQQFKKWFSGKEKAKFEKVVTIQKCFRTSDIEKIGDKTHLTFFEMMGNFSFNNSYFKKEAIEYAWEFLTDEKWLGIDKERIFATYFAGDKDKKPVCRTGRLEEDRESLSILKK